MATDVVQTIVGRTASFAGPITMADAIYRKQAEMQARYALVPDTVRLHSTDLTVLVDDCARLMGLSAEEIAAAESWKLFGMSVVRDDAVSAGRAQIEIVIRSRA